MHEKRGNFCIFLLTIAEKEGETDLLAGVSGVQSGVSEVVVHVVLTLMVQRRRMRIHVMVQRRRGTAALHVMLQRRRAALSLGVSHLIPNPALDCHIDVRHDPLVVPLLPVLPSFLVQMHGKRAFFD